MERRTQTKAKEYAVLTPKQVAADVLQRLPDDCSWEDILYHFSLAKSVMLGIEDIEAGRTITQEEMEQRLGRWQESSGQSVPLSS
jgi:hypothetical protein